MRPQDDLKTAEAKAERA